MKEIVRDTPKKEDECKNPSCVGGVIFGAQNGVGICDPADLTVNRCPLCLGTGRR